jgi:nicotinamidase-related amidase
LTAKYSATALLVVDMQNDFLKREGKYYVHPGRTFIPKVRHILEAAREKGIPVIFTQDNQVDDPKYSNDLKKNGTHCIEGTWGWKIVDELSPKKDEKVVKKREYSGFYGTSMDRILKERGIKDLIIVGATTNCCVRATVQDAFERGYSVTVPRDCVVSPTKKQNEVNLNDIGIFYGDVVSSEEAIAKISS